MKPSHITAFAGVLLLASSAQAVTTSVNSGSLGAAGNGTNSDTVTLGVAGPLAASGDTAVSYSGGANTIVAYNAAVNPPSSSAFTIEFWAKPSATTNDSVGPSPLYNRDGLTPRSGWVFFQRAPTTGWNVRLFDGASGTNVPGWDLTGGTNAADTWSHVVAVWSGSATSLASLYVNGVLVDNVNETGRSNTYAASTSSTFSVGNYPTGTSNAFSGAVDETALYATALTPAQILSHYNAAANSTPGFYSNLIKADGAVLYLNNVPEPTSAGLMLLGFAGVMRRRRK